MIMKKYIFFITLIISMFLINGYAFAGQTCCVKQPCKCVKSACCKDGKCVCKGDCCINGVCKCAEGKCNTKCSC